MIEVLRAGIKVKAFACLLALAFLFSITITAARADKDTYLVSGYPNQNFGADTTLDVKGDDNRRTLLEFDLPTMPTGAVIQTAVLQLYVTVKGTGTPTVNLYRINNSWTEGTGTGAITNNGATWNTKNGTLNWNTAGGDYETTVHANATLAAQNTWYSWNITGLVQAWANRTYPNYGMILRDITSSTGTWTFASSNNSNLSLRPKLNITYTELIAPSINSMPTAGIIYNQSNTINISVNVTDNYQLSTVLINLTYPNNSIQQIILINVSPDIFYTLFTETNQTGTYTIRITANDTIGNTNSTITTTFVIQDITPPMVRDITPAAGINYTQNVQVNISANATDRYANNINSVYANITKPNGTIVQINMTSTTGGSIYTANFTDTSEAGVYTVRIIANDNSNNVNSTETIWFNAINNTPTNTSNITPTDTTPPAVLNITPLAGTNFSLNSIVDITVNATDGTAVDTVFANITNPDLTMTWIQLFDADNDTIFNNSIAASQAGWYYITIIANDTSGNVNNTEKTHFDPASLGGGGRGGGGGVAMQAYQSLPDWKKMPSAQIIRPPECIESWLCMPWTECDSKGYKTRICEDYYQCGTNKTIPLTQIKCPETSKTANTTTEKKESKAEEPRYAVSLLLPPEQTATTISSAGLISVIILIGISAYLLLRKKKRNKKPAGSKEPAIFNTTESREDTTIPDLMTAINEKASTSNAAENKPKEKTKKKRKQRKKTKLRKKK